MTFETSFINLMNNSDKNPTTTPQELADKIDGLARITADGFASVDKRFEQVDKRFVGIDQRFDLLEERIDNLEDRFDKRLTIIERKLDTVLYHDLVLHEKWIKQLADKVGVELVRI